jgi:CubicO group peptidase (beta-lactamase class C family)
VSGSHLRAFEKWPESTPEDAGFTPDFTARIDRAIDEGSLPNLHGLVVARNGQLVLERYGEGEDELLGRPLGFRRFSNTSLHDLRSISKSIVALLYGIALSEAKVPPLDAPLVDQFPYPDLARDPLRRRLTVEHALTMQLGLEWDETLPYTDQRNGEIAMEMAPDRYRYVLERPIIEEPGLHWSYCGGATALIAHLIEQETGVPLLDYSTERLFRPLGIEEVEWTPGSNGEASAAAGLRMRPRDLAKVGQLILNRGWWADRQVVAEEWLEQCFTPRVKTRWELLFGYHWYLGRSDRTEWIAANGNGGQHLFIAPSLNLVFAITAGNYNKWDGPNVPLRATNLVLGALA